MDLSLVSQEQEFEAIMSTDSPRLEKGPDDCFSDPQLSI